MKIAIRIRDNCEIYLLERGKSGAFELGDPAYGNEKHKTENVVLKQSLDRAIEAIESGFHPRMKGQDSGQWNMIAPANIKILEVPS